MYSRVDENSLFWPSSLLIVYMAHDLVYVYPTDALLLPYEGSGRISGACTRVIEVASSVTAIVFSVYVYYLPVIPPCIKKLHRDYYAATVAFW